MRNRFVMRSAVLMTIAVAGCDPAVCVFPELPKSDTRSPDRSVAADQRKPDGARLDARAPDGAAPRRYEVEILGVHSHIFKTVAIVFTVRDVGSCTDPKDLKTCKAISGLPMVAFSRTAGASVTLEQGLEKGKLDDNGDGTYTLTRSFSWFGAYVVGLKFVKDGQLTSAAFPYETSRGGGEKYFCDTNTDGTNDVAFQIRWNAAKEFVQADDAEVAFSIELQRSWNTPLNTTQPWSNSFDHLLPKNLKDPLPQVKLMDDKAPAAKLIETLTPVYKGKGIYEVKRKFAPADLGGLAERSFWLEVSFTDDAGCVVKSSVDPEEYYFTVTAKK